MRLVSSVRESTLRCVMVVTKLPRTANERRQRLRALTTEVIMNTVNRIRARSKRYNSSQKDLMALMCYMQVNQTPTMTEHDPKAEATSSSGKCCSTSV